MVFLCFVFAIIVGLAIFFICFLVNDTIKYYKKKQKRELTLNKNRYGGH